MFRIYKRMVDILMAKCKFWKKCKLYKEDCFTCNKVGGMYYADATEPAGCYRKMEEENE